MSDDTYCENCGGVCDECCGGSTKKFPTEKEQADDIVKMIMSNGYTIANLVFEDLKEKIHAHLEQKKPNAGTRHLAKYRALIKRGV